MYARLLKRDTVYTEEANQSTILIVIIYNAASSNYNFWFKNQIARNE